LFGQWKREIFDIGENEFPLQKFENIGYTNALSYDDEFTLNQN